MIHNMLNPNFKFNNFIENETNSYAYNMAYEVSENSSPYNFLTLYGIKGSGKTHILNAIGNRTKDFKKKVLYITSLEFSRKLDSKYCYKYFLEYDILLIDDIQDLSLKENSQEELYKLFYELYRLNKQIVVTIDTTIDNLNVLDKLKECLCWGFIIEIK